MPDSSVAFVFSNSFLLSYLHTRSYYKSVSITVLWCFCRQQVEAEDPPTHTHWPISLQLTCLSLPWGHRGLDKLSSDWKGRTEAILMNDLLIWDTKSILCQWRVWSWLEVSKWIRHFNNCSFNVSGPPLSDQLPPAPAASAMLPAASSVQQLERSVVGLVHCCPLSSF